MSGWEQVQRARLLGKWCPALRWDEVFARTVVRLFLVEDFWGRTGRRVTCTRHTRGRHDQPFAFIRPHFHQATGPHPRLLSPSAPIPTRCPSPLPALSQPSPSTPATPSPPHPKPRSTASEACSLTWLESRRQDTVFTHSPVVVRIRGARTGERLKTHSLKYFTNT